MLPIPGTHLDRPPAGEPGALEIELTDAEYEELDERRA